MVVKSTKLKTAKASKLKCHSLQSWVMFSNGIHTCMQNCHLLKHYDFIIRALRRVIITVFNPARCHYNAVQHCRIFHTALQWLRQNIYHETMKTTPYLTLRGKLWGVFVGMLEKIDCDITSQHCTSYASTLTFLFQSVGLQWLILFERLHTGGINVVLHMSPGSHPSLTHQ